MTDRVAVTWCQCSPLELTGEKLFMGKCLSEGTRGDARLTERNRKSQESEEPGVLQELDPEARVHMERTRTRKQNPFFHSVSPAPSTDGCRVCILTAAEKC